MSPRPKKRGLSLFVVVGIGRLTLHLPESHSLKSKRALIGKLVARVRARFNISAAEVDALDLWQKAVVGLALAAPDETAARHNLEAAVHEAENITGLKSIDVELEFRHL